MQSARWKGLEQLERIPECNVSARSLETDQSVAGELTITLELADGEPLAIHCAERRIRLTAGRDNWRLQFVWDDSDELPEMELRADGIGYTFNGHPYRVELTGTETPKPLASGLELPASGREVILQF